MINIINRRLSDSKDNFIVIPVNCTGEIDKKWEKIISMYPHAEKEYIKYIKKCDKNKLDMLGTAQYIPVDVWAMVMVDTTKNNMVEAYDEEYQYVVNAFVQEYLGKDSIIDVIAVQRILEDIKSKAENIGATIAIPHNFAVGKNIKWSEMSKIIDGLFKRSDVILNIYKGK